MAGHFLIVEARFYTKLLMLKRAGAIKVLEAWWCQL